jgi:FKBP-type peptidyl-prolyl cis-trans isomerase SlyD
VKVAKDKVVSIDYTLTVNGEVVDSSQDGGPLTYLHGHGNIVPGLERALTGLSVGESQHVEVGPEEGYGEWDEDGEQMLPREAFPEEVEVGATYVAESEDGQPVTLTVVEVEDDGVRVDFNHPLAGETLDFDVTVRGVRDATGEELSHGHVHDGHEHH